MGQIDSSVFPWSGLITGIGGIAAAGFNYASTQSTNRAQERIARETRAWQEGMMNKQNAYNDPRAVMSRLAAAGLNPNLAFGDSAASSMLASSAQPASTEMPNLRTPLVDTSIAAQAVKAQSDARLNNAKADEIEQGTRFSAEEHPFRLELLQQDITHGQATLGYLEQMINESKSRSNLYDKNALHLEEKTKVVIQDLKEQFATWGTRWHMLMTDSLIKDDERKIVQNQRKMSDTQLEYFGEQIQTALKRERALIGYYRDLGQYYKDKNEREEFGLSLDVYRLSQEERRLTGQLQYWDALGDHFTRRDIIYGVRSVLDALQMFAPKSSTKRIENWERNSGTGGRWQMTSGSRFESRSSFRGRGSSSRF